MPIKIQVIDQIQHAATPLKEEFQCWINHALQTDIVACEVTLCLVSKAKSAMLNEQYRQKTGPTNVLAFEYPAMPGIPADNLGDLIICSQLVAEEAATQSKLLQAHWAHLIIHGMLHLQGFDHEIPQEAEVMEQLETKLLQELGFANPYL